VERHPHERLGEPQPRRHVTAWRVAVALLALWGAVTALVWAIGLVQRVSTVVVAAVVLLAVVMIANRS
jgi:hypothetical protein